MGLIVDTRKEIGDKYRYSYPEQYEPSNIRSAHIYKYRHGSKFILLYLKAYVIPRDQSIYTLHCN